MSIINIPPQLEEVTPFQAIEVFQAAKLLEAQGRNIIHLEFGEPDFPTPSVVKDEAIRAMLDNHTKYTHSLGILSLRETIVDYHRRKYGVEVDPDQILVSNGTSVITQILMLSLLEPGDEVILPDPTYACYANFVRLAHGVPVSVPVKEEDGYQLDPEAVKERITSRTRALMICSPANPTGVVLKPEVLKALAELGIPVISDEIYHGLTYAGAEHTMLEYTDNCIVLNGFSKYFAMTGWRLGYVIFPKKMQSTLMKVHQNVMISATEFIQLAGQEAMLRATPECETYKREYDRRRVYMVDRLKEIGLPLGYEPAGAFYCFANAKQYGEDSLALAMDILDKTGVAVTPGIDFGPGGEGYLRLSFANSLENIAEGMDRLGEYLAQKRK